RVTLSSLRDISVGGDVARCEMSSEHYKTIPWARLYNDYGPTEATVWTTAYLCRGDERGSVPIGRPIQNVSVHVLDSDLNPQPVGVPGELYIGGDNLARGYLKRPALTAAAFIPNPFASLPGQRLYRTGDRVRFLPDGNLQFLV